MVTSTGVNDKSRSSSGWTDPDYKFRVDRYIDERLLPLIENGFAIFPVQEAITGSKRSGKLPFAELAPHGCHDATTDLDQIRRWWTERPTANIGLATGEASDVFVIDIDGPEGRAAFEARIREHGDLPPTMVVRTPGGGWHFYFRRPEGVEIRNRQKVGGAPIDVRGEGGFVLAPGSRHHSGGKYFRTNKYPPAEAPAWIIEFATSTGRFQPPERAERDVAIDEVTRQYMEETAARIRVDDEELSRIVARAMRYVPRMRDSIETKGGQTALWNVANVLIRGFALPMTAAKAIINIYNDHQCFPPWSDKDLSRKLNEAAEKSRRPLGYLLTKPVLESPAADLWGFETLPSAEEESCDKSDHDHHEHDAGCQCRDKRGGEKKKSYFAIHWPKDGSGCKRGARVILGSGPLGRVVRTTPDCKGRSCPHCRIVYDALWENRVRDAWESEFEIFITTVSGTREWARVRKAIQRAEGSYVRVVLAGGGLVVFTNVEVPNTDGQWAVREDAAAVFCDLIEGSTIRGTRPISVAGRWAEYEQQEPRENDPKWQRIWAPAFLGATDAIRLAVEELGGIEEKPDIVPKSDLQFRFNVPKNHTEFFRLLGKRIEDLYYVDAAKEVTFVCPNDPNDKKASLGLMGHAHQKTLFHPGAT